MESTSTIRDHHDWLEMKNKGIEITFERYKASREYEKTVKDAEFKQKEISKLKTQIKTLKKQIKVYENDTEKI